MAGSAPYAGQQRHGFVAETHRNFEMIMANLQVISPGKLLEYR
jgi:hypothetical protein